MELTGKSEQEKRKLIIESLDKNIFVEAGAGAGKTSIIVARIIGQLKAGMKPGRIVAITFTNAATRELKGRILNAAVEAERDPNMDDEQRQNIKNALETIDQMQISTIHGFCHRLLAERCFDAGLPMGFSIIENDEEEQLFERSFVRWAEETLKEDDWKQLFRAKNINEAGGSRRIALENIKGVARQISYLSADMNVCVALEGEDPVKADADMDQFLNSAQVLLDTFTQKIFAHSINAKYTKLEDVPDEFLSAYGKRVKESINAGNRVKRIKELCNLPATKNVFMIQNKDKDMTAMGIPDNQKQTWKSQLDQEELNLKNWIGQNSKTALRNMNIYINDIYRPYVRYAQSAVKYYREHFPTNVLTNDLLLQYTLKLVRESDEVRDFFREKFDCYYVDEFQDTDHVQEEFIRRLAEDSNNPGCLRDGALFVVGDPKQSIYRFRGAEPEVYFATKERMKDQDNTLIVELSDNYRSSEEIIKWVNEKFKEKEITPGNDYVPMNAKRDTSALDGKANINGFYQYASPEEPLKKADLKNDAAALCSLIRKLIDGKYMIEEDGKLREVRYSDFLILCMYTPMMSTYSSEMQKNGIPYVMDSKIDISGYYPVNCLVRMYAYLTTPYDVAAKVGAMEAMRTLDAADRDKNARILQQLQEDTKKMSGYGCLQYLMEHMELVLMKNVKYNDFAMADIQKKLTQMAEAVQTEGHKSREAILEALKTYVGQIVEREVQLEKEPNAVRFMNLHKAKGLEGNIVIWTSRVENMGFKGTYRMGRDFYPTINGKIKGVNVTLWAAYNGDDQIIDQAQAEDMSESIRLEYVAATRARQAFVFMDRYSKVGNMFSTGYDLTKLKSVKDIVAAKSSTGGAGTTVTPTVKPFLPCGREEEAKRCAESRLQAQALFLDQSPSELENENAGKQGMLKETPVEEQGNLKRPTGNIFGTVMHRSFELLIQRWQGNKMSADSEMEGLYEICIRQAINESRQDIPEGEEEKYVNFLREAISAWGKWFASSELSRNGVAFYTELPFSYLKETENADEIPVWMHGEMDLVVKCADGTFWVLDYKSDNDARYPDEAGFEERLRGKYFRQIEAYKDAVVQLFGVDGDKVRASLISFSQKDLREGENLRVRVTEFKV